jgi:hypothetical protein
MLFGLLFCCISIAALVPYSKKFQGRAEVKLTGPEEPMLQSFSELRTAENSSQVRPRYKKSLK